MHPQPTEETLDAWKRAAARAAVAGVPDGATLGLGTGSTAELMVRELAERVSQGLRVTAVPTSERTRELASSLGIPVVALDSVDFLTMSIDGADEVLAPQLSLVKGLGGALLREKMIAAASRYRVIIADATKRVAALGERHFVPVEVVAFGWRHTAGRLVALGLQPALRERVAGQPFVTDGGNYILDCRFAPLAQPEWLAAQIKATLGVVESGFFVGMTERVYLAGPDGVQVFDRLG